MSVLLVVSSAPYGSEGPFNALRLAEALVICEEHVEIFLMGDAVHAARVGTIHQLAAATVHGDRVISF